MTNAITYYRASTNEKLQKNSILMQKAVCEAFAARHGYELVASFQDYASGALNEREQFNAALAYAVENDCKIISWKIDRISRNLSVFSKIEPLLDRFLFCELGNQAPSMLVLSVLLSVAAQERLNTSSRVKLAYKTLKESTPADEFRWGNPNMNQIQHLGIAAIKENAKAHNDRITALCDDFRRAGYDTIKQLVVKLAELGVQTRRGKPYTYHNLYRVLSA